MKRRPERIATIGNPEASGYSQEEEEEEGTLVRNKKETRSPSLATTMPQHEEENNTIIHILSDQEEKNEKKVLKWVQHKPKKGNPSRSITISKHEEERDTRLRKNKTKFQTLPDQQVENEYNEAKNQVNRHKTTDVTAATTVTPPKNKGGRPQKREAALLSSPVMEEAEKETALLSPPVMEEAEKKGNVLKDARKQKELVEMRLEQDQGHIINMETEEMQMDQHEHIIDIEATDTALEEDNPKDIEHEENNPKDVETEEHHPKDVEREEQHSNDAEHEENHPNDVESKENHPKNVEHKGNHPKDVEHKENHPKNVEHKENHPKYVGCNEHQSHEEKEISRRAELLDDDDFMEEPIAISRPIKRSKRGRPRKSSITTSPQRSLQKQKNQSSVPLDRESSIIIDDNDHGGVNPSPATPNRQPASSPPPSFSTSQQKKQPKKRRKLLSTQQSSQQNDIYWADNNALSPFSQFLRSNNVIAENKRKKQL